MSNVASPVNPSSFMQRSHEASAAGASTVAKSDRNPIEHLWDSHCRGLRRLPNAPPAYVSPEDAPLVISPGALLFVVDNGENGPNPYSIARLVEIASSVARGRLEARVIPVTLLRSDAKPLDPRHRVRIALLPTAADVQASLEAGYGDADAAWPDDPATAVENALRKRLEIIRRAGLVSAAPEKSRVLVDANADPAALELVKRLGAGGRRSALEHGLRWKLKREVLQAS